jgi:hypothetical protein
MLTMNWKCAIFAGLIVVSAVSANAQTTLYVDGNTGNDAVPKASNSAQTPWRSIGRAVWGSTNRTAPNASEAAAAGDTVRVAGGTYTTATATNNRYEIVYNPVNSGSPSAPITIQCVGRCVLGAPNANGPAIGAYAREYIKWYADVMQGHAWQIRAYGRQAGSASATEVNTAPDTGPVVCAGRGCWVEGAEIDGGLQVDYTDNWNGIRVDFCSDCVIRNNTIRNFRNASNSVNGTAVTLYGSPNTLVENNYATNVATGVIFKDTATTPLQRNVRVRFNRIDGVDRCFEFSMSNGDRNYIFQNVCSNSGIGLFTTLNGLHNDWIFNNTFYNISSTALYPSAFGSGGRLWNNIFLNADRVVISEAVSMPLPGVISLEHNVYFGHRQFYSGVDGSRTLSAFSTAYGHDRAAPASVEGNPMLLNPAGGDFRVGSGSVAAGRALDIFDLDGDGSTSDTITAGAHVTNNERIGVANSAPVGGGGGGTSQAPNPPTNLRVVSQ